MKREFISTVWIILLAVVAISFSCKKGPVPSLSGNPADYDPAGQALVTADQGADLLGDIGPQAQSMAKVPKGTVIDLLRMKSGVAPGVEDPSWAIASHQGKIGWIGTGSIFRYDLARVKELPAWIGNSVLVIGDGNRSIIFKGLRGAPRAVEMVAGGTISKNGKHMAWMLSENPNVPIYNIFMMNLITGDIQKLEGGHHDMTQLFFAPGDRYLVIQSPGQGEEAESFSTYIDLVTGKRINDGPNLHKSVWIDDTTALVDGEKGVYLFNVASGNVKPVLPDTVTSKASLYGIAKSKNAVIISEARVSSAGDWDKENRETTNFYYEFDLKTPGSAPKKIGVPPSSGMTAIGSDLWGLFKTVDSKIAKKYLPPQYADASIELVRAHPDQEGWFAMETSSGVFIAHMKGAEGNGVRIVPGGKLAGWR
ncbi:MAG TPA: hypothetical protein PKY31_00250 [Spirochaetota bacterium]|nr:hypothetical protein [Spirochaetota bacterium]